MAVETFYRDLATGKDVEVKCLTMVHSVYPDAYLIDGYCKEWDIYIPSVGIGIESKYDLMSQKTGNIVVEVMFDGKPSALSTTKAKYWFFYTGLKWIVVDTDDLRQLVKKFKLVKFTAKGDTKEKQAYLIPQRFIEGLHITLFDLPV